MEDKDVVVIKKELMEWRKFKKMVSVFTYLEIPAYLFTILAVVGGAFFLYEGVPFDFENVEIQLLLAIALLAVVFMSVSTIRTNYLMKKAYNYYMERPSVLKNELFGLSGGYCFYIESGYESTREQIENVVVSYLEQKNGQFNDSKRDIAELREILSKNFDIELQGTIKPQGLKHGMIVGYEEEETIFIFKVANAKGKKISLYNLDRISELELRDIRIIGW